MKLSEDLKSWRAERPDEWTMDRFIKETENLEKKFKIAMFAFQKILDSDSQPYDFIYKTIEEIEGVK